MSKGRAPRPPIRPRNAAAPGPLQTGKPATALRAPRRRIPPTQSGGQVRRPAAPVPSTPSAFAPKALRAPDALAPTAGRAARWPASRPAAPLPVKTIPPVGVQANNAKRIRLWRTPNRPMVRCPPVIRTAPPMTGPMTSPHPPGNESRPGARSKKAIRCGDP
jgi:hypothetical protein